MTNTRAGRWGILTASISGLVLMFWFWMPYFANILRLTDPPDARADYYLYYMFAILATAFIALAAWFFGWMGSMAAKSLWKWLNEPAR